MEGVIWEGKKYFSFILFFSFFFFSWRTSAVVLVCMVSEFLSVIHSKLNCFSFLLLNGFCLFHNKSHLILQVLGILIQKKNYKFQGEVGKVNQSYH